MYLTCACIHSTYVEDTEKPSRVISLLSPCEFQGQQAGQQMFLPTEPSHQPKDVSLGWYKAKHIE